MRNMAVLHSPAFSYPLPVLVRVLSNLLIFKGKILYYNKYIQNIGYLRLKNLVIGYTLPDRWMKKVFVQHCRLYVSGENLLTWTPFVTDYIDPEQPVADSNGRSYPMSKTFSVGLDITF